MPPAMAPTPSPQDEPLPPVLCFAMGSLGFLTPFDAGAFVPTLERVLDTSRWGGVYCIKQDDRNAGSKPM